MGSYDALEKDLAALLNKYSRENESDTPDFILAEYMLGCLDAFEIGVNRRDGHREEEEVETRSRVLYPQKKDKQYQPITF